jgi:guanylate kinase
MLIILSGVSGVGKNTVIKELMKTYKNMHFFLSATTRPPRPEENLYINLTPDQFAKAKEAGEFFETEEVHGFMYGTRKCDLETIIQNPENIYIKDIDVHGNRRFRNFLQGKAKVLSIFLEAPDDVLLDRLIKRGESEERAKIRISRSKMEREYKCDYDIVIENLNLQKTLDTINAFIKKYGFNQSI